MIYLLKQRTKLSEFVFANIKDAETIFYPVIKKSPFTQRLIKALYYKINDNFFLDFFPSETSLKLKSIRENDTLIVVGEDIYTYWVVSNLCRRVKHKVAFFWNSESDFARQKCTRFITKQNDKAKAIVSYIHNLGFCMASFDQRDAKLYNMFFFPQFYRFVPVEVKENYKYTFFFCGRDKGRKKIIDFYKNMLVPYGYCKFIVMSDGQANDPVPYDEYVEYIKNTEILCEAVQKNQTGLTVRAMEALFFNKKLITNSIEIMNYEIYHPNNILVINSATTRQEIEDFIRKPIVKIDDVIKSNYDVNTFVKILDKYARNNPF